MPATPNTIPNWRRLVANVAAYILAVALVALSLPEALTQAPLAAVLHAPAVEAQA